MIRFFKVFINLLYGTFTMGIIAIIVWGANWMVNTGGHPYDVPNLITNDADDPEKTIYFSDVVNFNLTSVGNAHKSHEIFIGNERNGEEELFKFIPMGWFNRTVTWTKNVVIAIVSPSYEIEQMDRYRHAFFLIEDPALLTGHYVMIDYQDFENGTYKVSDIYGIIYGSKSEPIIPGTVITRTQVEENGARNDEFQSIRKIDFKFDNEIAKYKKYNDVEYESFEKFLVNKPVAKWAFAEIIIIFALTIFVVYQNPIDFAKNERGVTEINRGPLPRIPMPKRREKRYRREKRDRY